jgi:hypothetical protein
VTHEHEGNINFTSRFTDTAVGSDAQRDDRYKCNHKVYNEKHRGTTRLSAKVNGVAADTEGHHVFESTYTPTSDGTSGSGEINWYAGSGDVYKDVGTAYPLYVAERIRLQFAPSRLDVSDEVASKRGEGLLATARHNHDYLGDDKPGTYPPEGEGDAKIPTFRVMIGTSAPHSLYVGNSQVFDHGDSYGGTEDSKGGVDTGIQLKSVLERHKTWRWWFNFPSTFGNEGAEPDSTRGRFKSETGFSNLKFVTM